MQTPDELLGPFITAVAITLREVAGVEVVALDLTRATGDAGPAGVVVFLRLESAAEGWLALKFPDGTAAAVAGRVLAETGVPLDRGMSLDCVAELASVIAGQAKTLLYGTPRHFTFSTPQIPAGAVPAPADERWVVRFDSDVGEFALDLGLPATTADISGTHVTRPEG